MRREELVGRACDSEEREAHSLWTSTAGAGPAGAAVVVEASLVVVEAAAVE